jgi:CRISPR-associated protein Cmr2
LYYNKFPLYEALNISRSLLFDEAKKEPKDAIAFKVIKHSGQMFGATLFKGDERIYQLFQSLLLSIHSDKDSKNFLGSFHHKLLQQKNLIDNIAHNKEKIENYFKNNFNKSEHDKYKEFFEEIGDFIFEVYNSNVIKEKQTLIYSTLRFIKFIKGDES